MSSGFHPPGSFAFDQSVGSGHPLGAAIFRPPLSPSPTPSTYNLVKSTGSLCSDTSKAGAPVPCNAKRKRAQLRRPGLAHRGCRPGDRGSPSVVVDQQDAASGHDREKEQQPVRYYTLAGQIDTVPPGEMMTGQYGMGMPRQGRVDGTVDIMEDSAVYSDVEYRRAMGSKRQRQRGDQDSPPANTAQARPDDDDDSQDPAGAGEQHTNPSAMGWSTFALHTIGGVVGKVWEFCKNGGFRGFYAGGGRGYAMGGEDSDDMGHDGHNDSIDPEHGSRAQFGAMQGMSSELAPSCFPRREATPCHPGDDDLSTPESTPRPRPKRRQLNNMDELHRNWVLVGCPPGSGHTSRSGISRNIGAGVRPMTQESWVSQQGTNAGFEAGRPSLDHYHAQPAASSGRRISVPVSRLSTGVGAARFSTELGHHSNNPNPFMTLGWGFSSRPASRGSHAGSPGLAPREPASFAQARSPVFSTRAGSPDRASGTTRIPGPAPDHLQQRRHQLDHSSSITSFTHSYGLGHRPPNRRSTFTSLTSPSLASFSSFSSRAPPSLVSSSSACSPSLHHRRAHSTASTATGSLRRLSPRKSAFGISSGLGSFRPGGRTARTTPAAAAAAGASTMTPGRQAAAMRRPLGAASNIQASPRLTPEAKQLARRRLAAEREVDERVGAAGAQVQRMIRQAKEALGTKVEVEMDDYDDDGDDDGDDGGDGDDDDGSDKPDGCFHDRDDGAGGEMEYGRNDGYGTGLGISEEGAHWEDEDEVL